MSRKTEPSGDLHPMPPLDLTALRRRLPPEPRHPIRSQPHRPASSRPRRQRHLRVGRGTRARRPGAAPNRGSRSRPLPHGSTRTPRWRISNGWDWCPTSAHSRSCAAVPRRTARATASEVYASTLDALAARREGLRLRLLPPRDRAGRRAIRSTRRRGTPDAAAIVGCHSATVEASRVVMEPGEERFDRRARRQPDPDAGRSVRRPAAPRPERQLDLSVRGGGGRHAARGGPGDPRRGPAVIDRPAAAPGAPARPGAPAGVPASSADPEAGRRQAQQVERRHRHRGAAAGGRAARERCWGEAAWRTGLLGERRAVEAGGVGWAVSLEQREESTGFTLRLVRCPACPRKDPIPHPRRLRARRWDRSRAATPPGPPAAPCRAG